MIYSMLLKVSRSGRLEILAVILLSGGINIITGLIYLSDRQSSGNLKMLFFFAGLFALVGGILIYILGKNFSEYWEKAFLEYKLDEDKATDVFDHVVEIAKREQRDIADKKLISWARIILMGAIIYLCAALLIEF